MAGSGSTSPCSSRVGSVRPREALALNRLLAGSDVHAENYSLLLSGAQVQLAPLYDVARLALSGLPRPKFTMAMKLGGTYLDRRVSTKQWRTVAAQLALEGQDVLNRIHQPGYRTCPRPWL